MFEAGLDVKTTFFKFSCNPQKFTFLFSIILRRVVILPKSIGASHLIPTNCYPYSCFSDPRFEFGAIQILARLRIRV